MRDSFHQSETGPFRETVRNGAERLGLSLDEGQLDAFEGLAARLLDWNKRVNLTALRDPADVAVKHVLDSLTCLAAYPFPQGARVIDVGTGAGFPGLALKIARPDLDMVLLDSTRKKLDFADHVIEAMGWNGARVLSGRAEEAGRDPAHREAYDIVVARAVAPMRILCELCLPLATVGGVFLAMKGPGADAEMEAAGSALRHLGGGSCGAVRFHLPWGGGDRAVIVLEKARPTPAPYPRRFRDIKQSPL